LTHRRAGQVIDQALQTPPGAPGNGRNTEVPHELESTL